MQRHNIPIGTLVDMYKRGEVRLPEIQRHDVWRATRVFLSTDPVLSPTERYLAFLQLRRADLAARMNASIEEKAGR